MPQTAVVLHPLKKNCFFRLLSLITLVTVAHTCAAALQQGALDEGVVTVTAYNSQGGAQRTSGFVVQADRFNGYVVTSASLVEEARTIAVTVPGTSTELIAQLLADDSAVDLALLKVNGLFTRPLAFSRMSPEQGQLVWSVHRFDGSGNFLVSAQGRLVESRQVSGQGLIWRHNANTRTASVVVNECGQVVGVNLPSVMAVNRPDQEPLTGAISVERLASFLVEQNLKPNYADTECTSAIEAARAEAARASAEARLASENAERAREVARQLEAQLTVSSEQNEELASQARLARERAEAAIASAEAARREADETRRELERRTAAIRAETGALMKFLEKDREAAEARYRQALVDQQAAAESRERLWLAMGGVSLLLVIAMAGLLVRRAGSPSPAAVVPAADQAVHDGGLTEMHNEALAEYVLDGRDEDGIRYLLRISGDQLRKDEGVIIGRNPQDSPYIINHADVSRRHARMRVMKNRVFIEDLGSTNGTSVNGQAIDDKGPVSIDDGDQIIIGSVVMKLRVLGA